MNFKKDVLPLLIAILIAGVVLELVKFGLKKLTNKDNYDYDEEDELTRTIQDYETGYQQPY